MNAFEKLGTVFVIAFVVGAIVLAFAISLTDLVMALQAAVVSFLLVFFVVGLIWALTGISDSEPASAVEPKQDNTSAEQISPEPVSR